MSDDTRTDRDESRRDFLKKAGIAAGATAWTVPAMQVIRMAGAGAQTADTSVTPTTAPPQACTIIAVEDFKICDGPNTRTSVTFYQAGDCSCEEFEYNLSGKGWIGGVSLPVSFDLTIVGDGGTTVTVRCLEDGVSTTYAFTSDPECAVVDSVVQRSSVEGTTPRITITSR